MEIVELFINNPVNAKLDLMGQFPIALQYSVADIRDISKRNAAYSKTIMLPGSKNNNYWFGNLFDVNSDFTAFNPNKKTSAKILVNGEAVIDGFLQLRKINKEILQDDEGESIMYECVIYNNFVDLMTELGEKTLYQLPLDEFNHVYDVNGVTASWSHTWEQGYVYPMIGKHEQAPQYNIDYFFPAAFYKMVFNKIIEEAGFGWTGSFKSNEQFEKEIILYVKDGNVFIDETERNRRKFRAGITQSQLVSYGRTPVSFSPNFPILPTGGTNVVPQQSAVYRYDDDFTSPNFDNGPDVFNTTIWNWEVDRTGQYDLNFGVDYDIEFLNDKTITMTTAGGGTEPVIIKGVHVIQKSINGGSTWTNLAVYNGSNLNFGTTLAPGATVSRNVVGFGSLQEVTLNQGDKVRLLLRPVQTTLYGFLVSDPPGSIAQGPLVRIRYKASANNYLFNDAYTAEIVQGDTIQLGAFLPDKIKQKDIISDLIKRYNLYIQVDPDNDRLLVIDERPNFYKNEPLLDWTYKKDHSQKEDIQLLSELQFKSMLFTWTEDDDLYNKDYRDITGDIYGQYEYIFDNDFVKGQKEIKSSFSPTPIVKTQFGAYVSAIDPTNPKVKPRILYWSGLRNCSTWQMNYADFGSGVTVSSTFSQYPYAGHWDDPIEPTLDINFWQTKFIYHNDWEQIPVNNMYNTYWADYIKQIEGGRLLSAYFDLDEIDIRFIKDNFNAKIFIKDSYYYVNKIIDYKPYTNETTKVELLKIEDGIKWVGNGNAISEPITTTLCPIDMIAKDFKGTFFYVSASGATVSQACCESIGGIYDPVTGSCRVRRRIIRPVGVGVLKPLEVNGSGNGPGGGIYVGSGNILNKFSVIDDAGFERQSRTMLFGDYNQIGADNSAVIGGDENIVNSDDSFIAMGDQNQIEGTKNFILGGDLNNILGGNNTLINSSGATVSGSGNVLINASSIIATESNIIYLGNAVTIDSITGDINVNGESLTKGVDGALSGRWELEYTDTSNPSTDAYFAINNPVWASASTIKFNVIAENGGDYSSYFNYVTSELTGGATMRIQVTNVNDNSNFAIFNTDDGASAFYGYIFNLLTADTIWNGTPSLTDDYAISFQLEPVGGTGGSYLYYTEPGVNQAQIDTLSPSGQIELINGDSAIGLYPTNVAISRGLTSSINIDDTGIQITNEMDLSSNKITNLANGTTASDAINLGQLNSTISGVIKSGQIEVADWALSGGTYKAVFTYSVAFASKPVVVITGGDARNWTVDPGAISFEVDSNSSTVLTLPTYWIATNAGS